MASRCALAHKGLWRARLVFLLFFGPSYARSLFISGVCFVRQGCLLSEERGRHGTRLALGPRMKGIALRVVCVWCIFSASACSFSTFVFWPVSRRMLSQDVPCCLPCLPAFLVLHCTSYFTRFHEHRSVDTYATQHPNRGGEPLQGKARCFSVCAYWARLY